MSGRMTLYDVMTPLLHDEMFLTNSAKDHRTEEH